MRFNQLIPELTVSNIDKSKQFYIDLLGFKIEYERKADRFAFIYLDEAQLMLEEYHEEGWNVAEMVSPFGRGVNFSIEVENIEIIYNKLLFLNYPIYRPITENRYETGGECVTQKEFLLQDPDGYLLRLTQE